MDPLSFQAICQTFEQISQTKKRLEIQAILSNFFKSLKNHEESFISAVYLANCSFVPTFMNKELNIGESAIITLISQITHKKVSDIKDLYKKVGDLATIAVDYRENNRVSLSQFMNNTGNSSHKRSNDDSRNSSFKINKEDLNIFSHQNGNNLSNTQRMCIVLDDENSKVQNQKIPTSMEHPNYENTTKNIENTLSITKIHELLKNLSSTNTIKSKLTKMAQTSMKCSKLELKYLIRLFECKLKIGLQTSTILTSMGLAFNIKNLDDVKAAYNRCPVFEDIIKCLFRNLSLDFVKIKVGVPVKPMLALACKDIKDLDNVEEFVCEFKYDGERAQIHFLNHDNEFVDREGVKGYENLQIHSFNYENEFDDIEQGKEFEGKKNRGKNELCNAEQGNENQNLEIHLSNPGCQLVHQGTISSRSNDESCKLRKIEPDRKIQNHTNFKKKQCNKMGNLSSFLIPQKENTSAPSELKKLKKSNTGDKEVFSEGVKIAHVMGNHMENDLKGTFRLSKDVNSKQGTNNINSEGIFTLLEGDSLKENSNQSNSVESLAPTENIISNQNLTKNKFEVKIFSRNSEDITEKYPDLIKLIEKIEKSQNSFIIDCEIVAYSLKENKILPFQTLTTRKRKQVKISEIKTQVCIYAFDILYHKNPIIKNPLSSRKQILANNFQTIEGQFKLTTSKTCKNSSELDSFFNESIKNTEGLMLKKKNGIYEPSLRSSNWTKLKKDYLEGLSDSLDLIVIGCYYGKGKRAGTFGKFLMAVHNEETGYFEDVCKLGTGFDDNQLIKFYENLKDEIIENKDFRVKNKQEKPDVWVNPKFVWEVRAASLSISPIYSAGDNYLENGNGISLRFPRFLRERSDKGVNEATTSKQIFEMFKNDNVNQINEEHDNKFNE